MLLVVDDNRELRDALAEFLSIQGHAVRCAANGNEALKLVADSRTRPNVILLDLVMPELDGWGFLALRRTESLLADVPVVIMSGCREVTPRAKEAGAVAVIRKPVEPRTILRVIEHFGQRT